MPGGRHARIRRWEVACSRPAPGISSRERVRAKSGRRRGVGRWAAGVLGIGADSGPEFDAGLYFHHILGIILREEY